MSPAEASVLEVLARSSDEFTGRRVAKLADDVSISGARKALMRLAQTGLVFSRNEPHATLYRANRQHVLWPAIEVALGASRELERRVISFVTQNSPGTTVALYGSVARQEATPASDIDVLVIHPDDLGVELRDHFAEGLREQLESWSGNDVQIYDLDSQTLRAQARAHDPIVDQWLSDAKTLTGPTVKELLAG